MKTRTYPAVTLQVGKSGYGMSMRCESQMKEAYDAQHKIIELFDFGRFEF